VSRARTAAGGPEFRACAGGAVTDSDIASSAGSPASGGSVVAVQPLPAELTDDEFVG
jgi:hypothetical protein